MSRLAIRSCVSVLLIALCTAAFALDPSLRPSQYVLDNWQIPEGLPQTSAQAIARHRTATCGSALRRDWRAWMGFGSRYSTAATNRPSPTSTSPPCSSTGPGACGSAHGPASQYSRTDDLSRPTRVAGIAHAYVHAITEGGAGRIWVGTENGPVRDRRREVARSFATSNGLRTAACAHYMEDRDGALWIGTGAA